jgi:hypothetical protein
MFRNRQILILNNRIAAERWPDEGKTRTERTENPAGKPLGLQYLFQEAIALPRNLYCSTLSGTTPTALRRPHSAAS